MRLQCYIYQNVNIQHITITWQWQVKTKDKESKTNTNCHHPAHHSLPKKWNKMHAEQRTVDWRKKFQLHFYVHQQYSMQQERCPSQQFLVPHPNLKKARSYILVLYEMQGKGWSAQKQDPQLSVNPTCCAS